MKDYSLAYEELIQKGAQFDKSVFQQPLNILSETANMAKTFNYKKSKSAPGSTGRMFFELLQRRYYK